jgi:hypothetical protein
MVAAPDMEPDRVFRVSPDAIFRDLDGEAVVLDLGRGHYFGLNAVATRIWQLIEEGAPAGLIVATLAAEYEAPPEVIEADVERLVEALESRGLLAGAGATPDRP